MVIFNGFIQCPPTLRAVAENKKGTTEAHPFPTDEWFNCAFIWPARRPARKSSRNLVRAV
jgi:hypothetical protein